MAEWDAQGGAGLGDHGREDRVSLQGVGPVFFAGVHVGFAGVAGGVDQEIRLGPAEKLCQQIEPGIIQPAARRRLKRDAPLLQRPGKGLADVAGASQ